MEGRRQGTGLLAATLRGWSQGEEGRGEAQVGAEPVGGAKEKSEPIGETGRDSLARAVEGGADHKGGRAEW